MIGIDSDTYDTEAGRTLKFHVINGERGIFDLTGNVIYPEQFTDKRQTFDSDTKAWADNQEPLYVTDANTAIDCTFGEIASNIIEGYYYQQALANAVALTGIVNSPLLLHVPLVCC